jgi:hypothetical protein
MVRSFALLIILGWLTAVCGFAQSDAAASTPDHPSSMQTQLPIKEDWARLPVDRTIMRPVISGASFGRSETPDYSSELVRLQWRAADPIDIWIIKPHGVARPRVALYVYSYPSYGDGFRNDEWCKAATRNGLAAVGFVSALTGDRFHGRPMREWFVRELQESMGSSVHDVQLIIDYLERRGDLNVDKVGMFGQGSGGAIAILAAAADPRIQAVDVLNPWGDWPDWLKSSPVVPENERSEFLTTEFLQKAAPVDPIAYLPALKGRVLRIQQILDYPNTPPAARDKIAEVVPTNDLQRYKNRTDHVEAWKQDGLSGWLAKRLESGSAPALKNGQIAVAPK